MFYGGGVEMIKLDWMNSQMGGAEKFLWNNLREVWIGVLPLVEPINPTTCTESFKPSVLP